MTKRTTLRNVAGLPDAIPALGDCALVLVDCQQTYREGLMQLAGVEDALAEAAHVLQRARALDCPVFHIQHDAGPGSPYDIRERIGAIADPVAPGAGEPVIVKHLPNAFIGTDLEKHIAATGRKDVIIVGFMTHMCINSTARGAFNLGLNPIVVATATATRDLPGPDGQTVPAALLQQASLAALGDLFARVVPTADGLPG
ncbi:cysteine hydrolase family protein [Nitrogeniibacter aestuarii]|uniref:cysteine hydrolase family protein n=1 Tax=Nitrogeniibacter aestuarii TaxID=2815343 RepID=UPI001D0F8DD4|nr:cysteine hydrolase family protein [Nitrogeniibacter aestuarii]